MIKFPVFFAFIHWNNSTSSFRKNKKYTSYKYTNSNPNHQ